MNNSLGIKYDEAIELLKSLIAIPSFSKEESGTADRIQQWLQQQGIEPKRHLNNIWAINKHFNPSLPTILLNSHHDTVRPNKAYTKDPFEAILIDDKLYGLGSNDAGGSLVSLLTTFCYFYNKEDLPFNLIVAATAEEEISGKNGISSLMPQLGNIHSAIVGEPTLMQMAVAERGLLVIDCIAEGKAGHAARNEGINAIYKAMMDIEWLYVYQFPKVSELLGPVKISVTSIETENKAHNVVPSTCKFIIDVRVNELYSLEEVFEIIQMNIQSKATPRSCRLRSSIISSDHPLVKAGSSLGLQSYGSPTSSDKALMPFPALKIGPGDSARSHTADEFIYVSEIRNGIDLYIQLLNKLKP
jgi:acetylornithine deacetylase